MLSNMGLAPEIAAVLNGNARERDPPAYEVADWPRIEELGLQIGLPALNLGEEYAAAGRAQQTMEPLPAVYEPALQIRQCGHQSPFR
jgi:hypothetical protein